MVDSFNHVYEPGDLSISQQLGIISLIPKTNKDLEYLKNWRLISLLNKAIAVRMERD